MKKLWIILAIFSLVALVSAQTWMPRSQTIYSSPAAGTQATVTIVAQDGVRHIADSFCFSGGATTAPTLTQLSVNLRDGATGAGTILQSFNIIVPASTGQTILHFCTPDIEVGGSNATAMTVEFSASLANLFENVSLNYHNVPQ